MKTTQKESLRKTKTQYQERTDGLIKGMETTSNKKLNIESESERKG
jgi:hypothetical protein